MFIKALVDWEQINKYRGGWPRILVCGIGYSRARRHVIIDRSKNFVRLPEDVAETSDDRECNRVVRDARSKSDPADVLSIASLMFTMLLLWMPKIRSFAFSPANCCNGESRAVSQASLLGVPPRNSQGQGYVRQQLQDKVQLDEI